MTVAQHPTQHSTQLVHYETACRALAAACRFDEVREIHNRAVALRAYARQARNQEMEADAAEIRLRAERRLGEMISKSPKAKGTRGQLRGRNASGGSKLDPPENSAVTLAEVGVHKALADRARKMAALPLADFEAHVAETRAAVTRVTRTRVRRRAQRCRAERLREKRRARVPMPENVELYRASIRDVESLRLGTARAVITDPPYGAKDLPLWGELVRFADRVLVEHGWLLAMSGLCYLPEVFAQLSAAFAETSIRYVWMMTVHLRGQPSTQVWLGPRNPLNSKWKPVLVMSKGEPAAWPGVLRGGDDDPRADLGPGMRDVLFSEASDKTHHKWGQNIDVFRALVAGFTSPGDLVVDPFLGGGTTVAAAHELGRAAEGFDADAACVRVASERVAQRVPDLADARADGQLSPADAVQYARR